MFSEFEVEPRTLDAKILRSATKLTKRDCKGFSYVEIDGEGPDLFDLAYTDWSKHSTIRKSNGDYN